MQCIVRNSGGFALILTILMVSLIVVMTLQFNGKMWADLYSSTNLSDGIRLRYIARSGVNCAMAVLAADASQGEGDSLQEVWASSREMSGNSTEMFDRGHFEVDIRDLSGRIQVNRLVKRDGRYDERQRKLLVRFLGSRQFGLDSDKVEDLVDAIKDWIDPDHEVTRFGAESSYYQSLKNPYRCKDGPMESLSEMLLIKGVSRELFYGAGDRPGISRYLTVYGDGRININTADPLVLKSLSEDIDTDMVARMSEYRLDRKNDLKEPGWYRNVPGMSGIKIDPRLIKTSSSHFEIESAGVSGGMARRIRAVVERKGRGPVKVLAWKVQ